MYEDWFEYPPEMLDDMERDWAAQVEWFNMLDEASIAEMTRN